MILTAVMKELNIALYFNLEFVQWSRGWNGLQLDGM